MIKAITLGTALLFTTPTLAQQGVKCVDRPEIAYSLLSADRWGEQRALDNNILMNSQGLFEVWWNEETGTWTILITRPDNKTCILASGNGIFKAKPYGIDG